MTTAILKKENIVLNAKLATKEEAIRFTGEVLVKQGYVDESYIEKMLEREQLTSTYMGNNVAIPHGTEDAKEAVHQSGIAVIQVPEGVSFGPDQEVKLLVGIAGKNNEHLEILSNIAIVLSDPDNIDQLVQAKSADEILSMFESVNA